MRYCPAFGKRIGKMEPRSLKVLVSERNIVLVVGVGKGRQVTAHDKGVEGAFVQYLQVSNRLLCLGMGQVKGQDCFPASLREY